MASTINPNNPIHLSVLFVCLGNICRSPMAEAVFQHLASQPSPTTFPPRSTICTDSCGTSSYNISSPPDPRTTSTLRSHGIQTYNHSARKLRLSDFETFDYIFAMDAENLEDLIAMRRRVEKEHGRRKTGGSAASGARVGNGLGAEEDDKETARSLARVSLFGAFGGRSEHEEVVDPYYGGEEGFEIAFEQVERFSKGFLRSLGEGMGNCRAEEVASGLHDA